MLQFSFLFGFITLTQTLFYKISQMNKNKPNAFAGEPNQYFGGSPIGPSPLLWFSG